MPSLAIKRTANPPPWKMGAKTLMAWGAPPPSELPNTALTGTGNADFVVNSLGSIAPAGTARSATASFSRSSYLLTGASGRVYNITIPADNDVSISPSAADEIMFMLYGPAGGGGASAAPILGSTIWLRRGMWNPTQALNSTSFRPLASYSGTGRFTVRSDTPDGLKDANGNPRLKHGTMLGRVYWDPEVDEVAPVDFRDVWHYTDAITTLVSGERSFGYGTFGEGVSHYNSRFEVALGNPNAVNMRAIDLRGGTADGNYFYNCGEGICDHIPGGRADPITPAVVSNNIFEGMLSDTIKIAGGNGHTTTRNFAFAWGFSAGEHQDGIQVNPGAVSLLCYLGEVSYNIIVQDLGGIVNSFLFSGDVVSPTNITNANIFNNLGHLGNQYGVNLNRPDAGIARYNTMLADPFLPSTIAGVEIAVGYVAFPGINGATVTHNLSNSVQINVTGSVTSGHNINGSNYPALVVNSADRTAYKAALQTMFPNYPASLTDTSWRTRAGCLRNFTPANLAFSTGVGGGVVWPDGQVSGMLFPAVSGQTIGAWNDGSVFSPNDPTWVAAHPPAT